MRKLFLWFLICGTATMGVLSLPFEIKAEDTASQAANIDQSKEPVAVVTSRGDVFVTYILKEDKNKIYIRNLNGTIEGEVERSEIANMRKPTAEEIRSTQERLGMIPKQATSQETK